MNIPLSYPHPPSPTSRDPGDGVIRSKVNFLPEQRQHKPTKTFVLGHARFQDFFCQGGGGGGGVQAPQLILQYIYRGGPMFFYTFSGGGGPTFPGGGGSNANFYRNPYNYNL